MELLFLAISLINIRHTTKESGLRGYPTEMEPSISKMVHILKVLSRTAKLVGQMEFFFILMALLRGEMWTMESYKDMGDLLLVQETFTTKENGKMMSQMERAWKFILMDLAIKANLLMGKKMIAMDIIDGLTAKLIKGRLEMDLWKGMENYLCKMEKVNTLGNFIAILKSDMEKWKLRQANIREHLKMEKCTGQAVLNGMMGKYMKANFQMDSSMVVGLCIIQMGKWQREPGTMGRICI